MVGGAALADAIDELHRIHPELSRFLPADDTADRGVDVPLEPRDWALGTVVALGVLGDAADQLRVYARAARAHSATDAELRAALTIASAYAGAPRAVTAAHAVEAELVEPAGTTWREGVAALPDHTQRG